MKDTIQLATPVGHSLAGYAVYRLLRAQEPGRRPKLLVLCILLANAPDFDFIPGMINHRPGLLHRKHSHAIGMAFAASFTIATSCRGLERSFGTAFRFGFISYLSHIILDYLSEDKRAPYGVPALWPFTDAYYVSPVPLFPHVRHAGASAQSNWGWTKSFMNRHNLGAVVREIALFLLGVLLWQATNWHRLSR